MEVCQIQTQAEAGGAQRLSHVIGEGLRALGHDVNTIYLYRKTNAHDREENATFLVDRPLTKYTDYLKAISRLFAHLRHRRPAAVLTYQHYGNVLGALAARTAGTPVVIANQSGLPWERGISNTATTLDLIMGSTGFYTHNIVNSHNTEIAFARYPWSYRKRLKRIDHGIEVPRPSRLSVYDTRLRFGLPLTSQLIITVGRLSGQKNHMVLIKALPILKNVHLVIAGDGALRAQISSLAFALNVTDRLHLLGEISHDDVCELVAAADVFVFPSVWETFGLAVVEAAVMGTPVAASDIPVLREVLSDDHGAPAALFFNPLNPNDMASKIKEILEDTVMAVRLTQVGQRLSEKYSIRKMLEGYDALLRPDRYHPVSPPKRQIT